MRSLLCLLGTLLLVACSPEPGIDTLTPRQGEIREFFEEPARTRLARDYRIAMPLDGRIGRIELEPGDTVKEGQELVAFERLPVEEAAREARAAVAELEQQLVLNAYDEIEKSMRVELQATVDAARDVLRATDAQVEANAARARRAEKEHKRIATLAQKGGASHQQLDDAALEAETAVIDLREQEMLRAAFNTLFTATKLGPEYIDEWLGRKRIERELVVQQLTQARARLARAEHDVALAAIVSPIDGLVLERFEQGGGPLPAGRPLLRLGDLEELEVIAEVLTQDALRLASGAEVRLTATGLGESLGGQVKRVEPAGFTKLSSLGVEQQRVKVVVAPAKRQAGLGVGYRLQARFFTGVKQKALIVPRFSVLQGLEGEHYLFKVVAGKLVRQAVEVGLRNDLDFEIVDGLSPDEHIVATPDTEMREGDPLD
jgi:HlyD family secretion protein